MVLRKQIGNAVVVGVIGHFGVGKDTVAEHLWRKHGFSVLSMYQPLRTLAQALYGEPSRTQIYGLGKTLSEAFGKDLFIWWCSKALRKLGGRVVVKDARFTNEIVWLSGIAKLVILVECEPSMVLERLKKRGRPGDPSDLEALKKMWENEGELESVKQLGLKNLLVVQNNEDLEALYRKVDGALEGWVV